MMAPAAQRLFVFEDPAAVVGQGLATEEGRVLGLRLVGEQHHDFSFDVDSFVIVPVKLRGDDAMPDVDRFGVDRLTRLLPMVDSNVVLEPIHPKFLTPAFPGEIRFGQGLNANQGDLLEVAAVITSRFQAGERKLSGDVFGRERLAGRGRAPAAQGVAGEELHVRGNSVTAEGRFAG